MNTSQLKDYAPKARTEFIKAVSAQAARFGITAEAVADANVQGDVLMVGGQAFPRAVAETRKKLVERVRADGFDRTMEAIAYTWFNRFVAMRYMELHGYLEHGYRVLSHPEGHGWPEILDHAEEVDLPGLDRDRVVELMLAGNKDEELYRLLLLAQCNALHRAMPFLFERIGDETELLLPANLLHTDSLVRQLVEQIDEALWQEIEIIGWLYQFYISEKKAQVIGKVVKSEDIPAATQLFTPNWIVKYMVQNSLGAQWLATYPQSPLKEQMEYYIEPAEQTDEVSAQLAAITPSQLNPEELTLIDPASGSGHILVEAYEIFKAVYLERGYRQRDVPPLILEKNLFGLDIDERAAQLTGFALMMKGRADDRRLFERGVKLNVMALVDSAGFDAEGLAKGVELGDYGLKPGDLTELKQLFEHATTFGSLIQVPEELTSSLPALKQLSEASSQDLFVSEALKRLGSLVQQAELLAAQYDAVVANPPYMGAKYYCRPLSGFIERNYPAAKPDIYACFMLAGLDLCRPSGRMANINIPGWMMNSSFGDFRSELLGRGAILSLVHNGRGVFGSDFGSCVFTILNHSIGQLRGRYRKLFDQASTVTSNEGLITRFKLASDYLVSPVEFEAVEAAPLSYQVSNRVRNAYKEMPAISDAATACQGLSTSSDTEFVRTWHEVGVHRTSWDESSPESTAGSKWFPYNKGGDFRKWYGNIGFVLNWEGEGCEIKQRRPKSVIRNERFYLRESISWQDYTIGASSFRLYPEGFIFATNAHSAFARDSEALLAILGFCNSVALSAVAAAVSPGLHFNSGCFALVPFSAKHISAAAGAISGAAVELARGDWDAYERSWDFQSLPLLTASAEPTPTLESSYTAWIAKNRDTIAEMKRLEEENNRLFIDAYGLQGELTPDVPIEQITLTVNPAYRYGGKLTEEEKWTRFRQDTMQELVSYAIGCMMGRYCLDASGLIYAHSGNEGFDSSRYITFPADEDGIVPITDAEWFEDDAANRVVEFVSVAWDEQHLEANLQFLADNLAPKKNESSRDTIRRYLCDSFFKDHLQVYKKRPIYWLFSSGKQKAFQCLVYLHRYNAGTLSRMRSEYVIPLQGKFTARLDQLHGDIQAATSTAYQKRLEKELVRLQKQQVELLAFDEKLRHYADLRIALDLDDGVKANYGKFGDLLAELKAVTGGKGSAE